MWIPYQFVVVPQSNAYYNTGYTSPQYNNNQGFNQGFNQGINEDTNFKSVGSYKNSNGCRFNKNLSKISIFESDENCITDSEHSNFDINSIDNEYDYDYDGDIEENIGNDKNVLYIINLPVFKSNNVNLSNLINDSLNNSNKNDNCDTSISIKNLKIFKSIEKDICWCSFELDKESGSNNDKIVEVLFKKIDGYEFLGNKLKCMRKLPKRVFDKNNNGKRANITNETNVAYQTYYPTPPATYAPNYYQPFSDYANYNYSYNYNYNYNGYNGYNNYMRHQSIGSLPRDNRRRRSSGNRRYSGSSIPIPCNMKTLGNDYNSIVYPNLNEEEEENCEKDGVEQIQDIDDDNKTIEELQEFREDKYISPTRLFVGNIPFVCRFQELWMFLTRGGQHNALVHELQLKTDSNGHSKGFAIVHTASPTASAALIALCHGQTLSGRRVVARYDQLPAIVDRRHAEHRRARDCAGCT